MGARILRLRPLLVYGVVVAGLVGLILFQAFRDRSQKPILEALTPAPTAATATPTAPAAATAVPTPPAVRIYVSGAVLLPDVYTLPGGSIVKDAVAAAGGASEGADLDRINLAQPLADGQQIYVPRRGETGLPSRAAPPEAGLGPVNVNTAGMEALDALPGIGPALAQRIIDYRQTHGPFQTIEQTMDVRGIGPALFEQIRDLITIQ